jgi:type IV pilus assembly protein PilP
MTRGTVALLLCAVLVASCGSEKFSDLKQFVKDSGEGLRGRVDPIPEIKQFEPFAYNAFDLADPFKPRATMVDVRGPSVGTGPQPDRDRVKEALEAFPLESLKMMGTLEQRNVRYALVLTSDNNIYRVKAGNFVGQNFGIITSISESTITLKEVIQDPATGSWTERTSSLELLEQ